MDGLVFRMIAKPVEATSLSKAAGTKAIAPLVGRVRDTSKSPRFAIMRARLGASAIGIVETCKILLMCKLGL